ncbi:D-alanyl-D-alanine carboxypeptidase/D-alanyl-D-alanine-endopeptidase [Desertifilum sp. FACHB-1129]|nr:D-alanyl-D-alanine carboxypeptidase/D-alanyl-D-alanine-endopeptidase [Desertifilum sp. FACHB-1129]MBD2324197.1 D-alanyl-D-alanine carboxypeptidase/D-alanyl-D-alanine-endopeptidase [Desertifilum sp. FACHB-866]MBD2334211.1 D-alanyl-D-alanine carboxypeptidase/D-alanyl-D-alanine-endopeptidase [Desertifilum sp. FACHB-868]
MQKKSTAFIKKTFLSLLLGLSSLSVSNAASASSPGVCVANLSTEINAIISRPEFARSRWGILVSSLNTSDTLYRHDAEKYFIPASNVKLLTTAAVLQRLTPNYRIRTAVYGNGERTQITVSGRSDPSFSDTQLQQLAQQLQQQGIQQVSQLIGDDFAPQEETVNPTWDWEDVQAGYGAPINRLILNQNAISFRLVPQALGEPLRVEWENPQDNETWQIENQSATVATTEREFIQVGRDLSQPILRVRGQLHIGSDSETTSIAVTDPANRFLSRFQQILQASGITVQQTSLTAQFTPLSNPPLAFVDSPPLSELLVETNQWSNNIYAEALVRQLGEPDRNALSQVEAVLTQLGVDPNSYQLADASGLSRQNLASPEAIVRSLQLMARSPYAQVYRNSLAVAAESGTLRNRFRQTPVAGNLQGKTGSLGGVMALSGYLEVPDFEPLAFSILSNHSILPQANTRQAIDEIVLVLSRLRRC